MTTLAVPAALNLANFDLTQRAAQWARSAGRFFPGLHVTHAPVNPAVGSIEGIPLGVGRLWAVVSPTVLVSYNPPVHTDISPMFSVMLQVEGTTSARQGPRSCHLSQGDFCLIDSLERFEIEVTCERSRVIFLQVPRHSILSRQPGLERRTAQAFGSGEPGAVFLSNVLINLTQSAPFLDDAQRAASLAGIVQLLSVPNLPGTALPADRNSRRIRAMLAFIDAEFSDSSLTASRVAEALGMCRRRLDQLLLQEVGTSLTAQIWTRRLAQAASDLLDSRLVAKTVTQIAFGAGFEDGAHFTRAFRRRYHCTPSEWRMRGGRQPRESADLREPETETA